MEDAIYYSDASFLKDLGERLARLRLARNWTQRQLAESAGLSVRTVQRLELGEAATQLSGFVRVCRALDLLPNLDALVPVIGPSPMAQLQLQGKQRQRARHVAREPAVNEQSAQENSKRATETRGKWTWGKSS